MENTGSGKENQMQEENMSMDEREYEELRRKLEELRAGEVQVMMEEKAGMEMIRGTDNCEAEHERHIGDAMLPPNRAAKVVLAALAVAALAVSLAVLFAVAVVSNDGTLTGWGVVSMLAASLAVGVTLSGLEDE